MFCALNIRKRPCPRHPDEYICSIPTLLLLPVSLVSAYTVMWLLSILFACGYSPYFWDVLLIDTQKGKLALQPMKSQSVNNFGSRLKLWRSLSISNHSHFFFNKVSLRYFIDTYWRSSPRYWHICPLIDHALTDGSPRTYSSSVISTFSDASPFHVLYILNLTLPYLLHHHTLSCITSIQTHFSQIHTAHLLVLPRIDIRYLRGVL